MSESKIMNAPPWAQSSPFLRLHLLLGHLHFVKHELFGELDQRIRPAGVENRVRQVMNLLAHPGGINAPATTSPFVLRMQARAGDVKVEVRVLRRQIMEFA